jgi:hypothetical protein
MAKTRVSMNLHITSGDIAGGILRRSGIPGEVFVWHDVLYEGPRNPGWPEERTLHDRAEFLENATGGGLGREKILGTLRAQYGKLERAGDYDSLVLWFDACLFDQSMLAHILTCMKVKAIDKAELICVDGFPGIVPFDGIGQLSPSRMASLYNGRQPVTEEQFLFAQRVDTAFALQDREAFTELALREDAPLPWISAAAARWLQELPDRTTGLGRLEQLTLAAVRSGHRTPQEIFRFVADHDTHPVYWGDATLWAKINKLAKNSPPLLRIEGPKPLLPQWNESDSLHAFRIYPL